MDELTPRKDPLTRRQFVKASVVAGTVGAAVAGGAMTLIPLSRPGKAPPRFKYWAVKVIPNPGTGERSKAPRGIPLIPVRINEHGEVVGRPDHLDWYRYCGRNNAPDLGEDFTSDNVFRYAVDGQVLEKTESEGIDAWYGSRLGQKATAADFSENGRGAPVLWRSEGHESSNPLTCLLLKVDTSKFEATIVEQFFPDGILGVFATCAHLCLVPTWRASRVGYGDGAWDVFTCFGHGSWYDPYQVVQYDFPPTG